MESLEDESGVEEAVDVGGERPMEVSDRGAEHRHVSGTFIKVTVQFEIKLPVLLILEPGIRGSTHRLEIADDESASGAKQPMCF